MSPSPHRRLLARVVREPTLYFGLAAVAILLAGHGDGEGAGHTTGQAPIRITTDAVEGFIDEREALVGRELTTAERAVAVDELIDEQVLVQEARRLGIDRDDAYIRSRLIQKMRLLLDEPLADPPDAELREYLEVNADRYRSAPTVTLRHVFRARERDEPPSDVLDRLSRSDEWADLHDEHALGPVLGPTTFLELSMVFGPAATRRIVSAPDGVWAGPIETGRGRHYYFVSDRRGPVAPKFDDIRPYLFEDWFREARRDAQQDKVRALRDGYDIMVEGHGGSYQ